MDFNVFHLRKAALWRGQPRLAMPPPPLSAPPGPNPSDPQNGGRTRPSALLLPPAAHAGRSRYFGSPAGVGRRGGGRHAPLGEVEPSKGDEIRGNGRHEAPLRRTEQRHRERDLREPERAIWLARLSFAARWLVNNSTVALSLLSDWLPLPAQPLPGVAACGAARSPQAGMAAAGGGGGSSSLLGSATTWPLKRYGRFLPPAESDDEGQNTSSWKVRGGAAWCGCDWLQWVSSSNNWGLCRGLVTLMQQTGEI